MNATHKICLLLLCLASLTGCRYTFDIEDNGLKPCLCMKAYICADSLTTIDVYKAVPVQSAGKADMNLVSPSYSLKRNSKEVEASSEEIADYGISLQCEEFKEGDKLELTFSADGLETAVATTSIPGLFPEFTYRTYKDEYGDNCISIDYKDDKDSKDYYGISIETRRTATVHPGHEPLVFYGYASPPNDHNDLSLDHFAYSPAVSYFGDGAIYIWADDDHADDTYEVIYTTSDTSSENSELAIRLHLFKLSREMYYHLYAEYDSSYNPFSFTGFSSPSFAYCNVMKGCGYFCAYSKDHSEWITIDKE